jgi:tetratricopeptide (TPR) repeat protein
LDAEEVLREALALAEDGDWEKAATVLIQALESFPDDPAILCWLGVAEAELGLPGSAYDRFKAALALGPEDPHLLTTIGNGLARFDDPDAEAALRSASVMAPDLARARWMFGAYLSREGLYEEAIRELTAAAELTPDDPVVAYEVGVALALQKKLDLALEALTRAADLDPGDGWTQVVLGLVEAEAERIDEAARDLSTGARLRPIDVEAQLTAALACMAAGFEDLAYEMLERGRQTAVSGDLPLLEAVEERLEEGPEESQKLLNQDVLPGILRERLMNRP